MMFYRGIEVIYEVIRKWCRKLAQTNANQIRRCHPKPADKWYLGRGVVVITIKSQSFYLWRAVDANGQIINILIQCHRDKRAAKQFFCQLLKSTGFFPSGHGDRQTQKLWGG
ncbi:MAG: DDE-type integrase/transposase/recombinase [Leptolyngbyaceae cyanobacterium]